MKKILLRVLIVLVFPCTVWSQIIENQEKNLIIASCQFPVSDQIKENAGWIMEQIREAHERGAHVVHFPECALSGYPGVDMKTMDHFQWELLHRYTDSICRLAEKLEIWVLLGSIHELEEGMKPMNSLYVIDPSGQITDRYDKRFCTKGDLDYFSADLHAVAYLIGSAIKFGSSPLSSPVTRTSRNSLRRVSPSALKRTGV